MAVSKLPSNSMQKESDESSGVSDTGLECFTCGWLCLLTSSPRMSAAHILSTCRSVSALPWLSA